MHHCWDRPTGDRDIEKRPENTEETRREEADWPGAVGGSGSRVPGTPVPEAT